MVFPLYDDNSDRLLFPYVNYTLIAINVFVFVLLQDMGSPDNKFTYAFSTVPAEIITGKDYITRPTVIEHPHFDRDVIVPGLERTPGSVYFTLIVSMFMHGGWAHILGNMLFLWIFGDNVEDFLGHVRYALFYLVGGIIASLAHVLECYVLNKDLLVPSLGASGAISAILGAYLVLYPHKRVMVILLRIMTEVPAYVAIGMWFVFQLISSIGTFNDRSAGGVAYAAHIGGFLVGMALIYPFAMGHDRPKSPVPPKLAIPPWARRPPRRPY